MSPKTKTRESQEDVDREQDTENIPTDSSATAVAIEEDGGAPPDGAGFAALGLSPELVATLSALGY